MSYIPNHHQCTTKVLRHPFPDVRFLSRVSAFTVCRQANHLVIFVVVGLLCDCRPVPQIILPLGGKKFPLGGIFAAQLQR